jgi:hypothetical protein
VIGREMALPTAERDQATNRKRDQPKIVPRPHDEESRLKLLGIEEGEKVTSVKGWTIIIGESPSIFVWAGRDVNRASTTTTSPPAAIGIISDSLGVSRTTTRNSRRDVGDGDTRTSDIVNPLLNFRGVSRRGLVQRRIVGRVQ